VFHQRQKVAAVNQFRYPRPTSCGFFIQFISETLH
jgi:hypothetical protein